MDEKREAGVTLEEMVDQILLLEEIRKRMREESTATPTLADGEIASTQCEEWWDDYIPKKEPKPLHCRICGQVYYDRGEARECERSHEWHNRRGRR